MRAVSKKYPWFGLTILVWVSLSSACSEQAETTFGPSGLVPFSEVSIADGGVEVRTEYDDFVLAFADLLCRQLEECFGGNYGVEFGRGDDCSRLVTRLLLERDMYAVAHGLAAGRLSFNGPQGEMCLAALGEKQCSFLLSQRPTEAQEELCDGVFLGQVSVGSSCYLNEECASGYCNIAVGEGLMCDESMGVCAQVQAADRPCTSDAACVGRAQCLNGTCRPTVGEGANCGEDLRTSCERGLECQTDTCVSAMTVEHGLAEGDPCTPERTFCGSGLVCRSDGAESRCVSQLEEGAACSPSESRLCGPYAFCRPDSDDEEMGTCSSLPGDGEPCIFLRNAAGQQSYCRHGFACVEETLSGQRVCRAKAESGTPCLSDEMCFSGLCVDNFCSPPPLCFNPTIIDRF